MAGDTRHYGEGSTATTLAEIAAGQPSGANFAEGKFASQLVSRIQGGDSTAEAQLYTRYERGLLFFLRRLGAPTELAEDLRQETFRIVLERLRSRGLDEPEGLVGFVRGTARHLFLAARRGDFRHAARHSSDDQDLEKHLDPMNQLSDAIKSQEAAAVRRVVAELGNDRDRQILYRFYLEEDDKAKICHDLGLSSLHFNRVLFRARRRCRELLTQLEPQISATLLHIAYLGLVFS